MPTGRGGEGAVSGFLSSVRDRVDPDPAGPMVVDLDNEEAGELLGALSSETARDIVRTLYEQPATLSEVAEAVGTSRQNAQYHIKQLVEVGAVRVVDTAYSVKGREMKVYAPKGEPLIIVSGDGANPSRLTERIARLFGPVVAIGLVSAAVQGVADWRRQTAGFDADGQYLSGEVTSEDSTLESLEANVGIADGEAIDLEEPLRIDVAELGRTLWEAYPGLVFFLGAMTALVLVTAWRHHGVLPGR